MSDAPEADASADVVDATYNPALYNAHLWIERAWIAVFLIGLAILGEPRVMPLVGLLVIASGVVALRAGRTMGSLFGHLLARLHQEDPREEQLELRRTYSRVGAVWRVIIGALFLGLSVYLGVFTR